MFLPLGRPGELLCFSLGAPDRLPPAVDSAQRGVPALPASYQSLANCGRMQVPVVGGPPPNTLSAGLGSPVLDAPRIVGGIGVFAGGGGSSPGDPVASGGSPAEARRSLRLVGATVATVLDRAMSRKIFLDEGAARAPASKVGKGVRGKTPKPPMPGDRMIRRIVAMSDLCGVSLSPDEACSVSTFSSCTM